jgi:hypothetical protein
MMGSHNIFSRRSALVHGLLLEALLDELLVGMMGEDIRGTCEHRIRETRGRYDPDSPGGVVTSARWSEALSLHTHGIVAELHQHGGN